MIRVCLAYSASAFCLRAFISGEGLGNTAPIVTEQQTHPTPCGSSGWKAQAVG